MVDTYQNLERYKEHVFRCYKCAYCVDTISNYSLRGPIPPRGRDGVCLVYRKKRFDHYAARGRLSIAQALLNKELSYSPGLVETVYMCLTCRSCVEQCMGNPEKLGKGIDVCSVVEAMRADIVEGGMAPYRVKRLASRIIKSRNLFGRRGKKRSRTPSKAETLLFLGCYSIYLTDSVAESALKIFEKAGIEFSVLEEEWCCGSPLLNLGFKENAREFALRNTEMIGRSKAKRIVFLCPHCYKTFKFDYPKIIGDFSLELKHITEFLEELLRDGLIKPVNPVYKRVTYHDPCRLGRYSGIYDAPRALIKAIPETELIESYPTRENTWCCGTGSTFRYIYGDLAAEFSAQRVKRAEESGADLLVSSCPECQIGLTIGIKRLGSPLEFNDLTRLVLQSL